MRKQIEGMDPTMIDGWDGCTAEPYTGIIKVL